MKRMLLFFIKHWRWLRYRQLYVIADPADNSITLSRMLFNHMNVLNQEQAKVFGFRVAGTKQYAFTLNPSLNQETQLSDIQYNEKYRTVGFAAVCPTVNLMCYDYGLPANCKVKLSVEPKRVNELNYYIILPPKKNDKPTKQHQKT